MVPRPRFYDRVRYTPLLERRRKPVFTLASRVMTIDGQTVPHDHFEEVNEPAV